MLRGLAVILLIAVGNGLLLTAVTGDKRYQAFAWRLLRYGDVYALIVGAFMVLERVAGVA